MIDFNATLFIQFANFIFLMVILNFILYRPLRKVIHQRRDVIEGSHAKADELAGKIAAQTAEYEAGLNQARAKGNEEKNALREAALEREKKLLQEAQEAATQSRASVRDEIAREMVAARKSLQDEVDAIGRDAASKLLGRQV